MLSIILKCVHFGKNSNIRIMNFILQALSFSISLLGLSINCQGQMIVVKPYLQNAEPTSMTIMWEVDVMENGQINYGPQPFAMNDVQTSTTQTGSGNSEIHTAVISGLTAGKKYYYQVRLDNGTKSNIYSFVTPFNAAENRPIQLIAISDMQRDGSHPNKFKEIVEEGIIPVIISEVGTEINDLEAVLIPGDLVPTGGSYEQWQNFFFSQSDSLFPYVPFYPVLGNHEYNGGGYDNFIKYFTLPNNGVVGIQEECWYKDISNIRIIGLNSNSGSADQINQLNWLSEVLGQTCNDNHIDFVFAELHHPFKSELWTPGENDFTGMVIDSLQKFTSSCNKPSIHFFGHTHGYSRGQSRDHKHLWVNVATAGGAIDNWGEFPNADYPEFVKSQDEYGFVLLNVVAGLEPKFTLTRFSRGDQDTIINNAIRDKITIYKQSFPPYTPVNIYPAAGDTISTICLTLQASEITGVQDTIQASHWQIASSQNFVDSLVTSAWCQNENFYFEVNLQADDNLTNADFNSPTANKTYYWRVRYRDQNLEWSEWSAATSFYYKTGVDTLSSNLLVNAGAETGTSPWIGDIESLENAECNSVPPYEGTRNFAVGGVCNNEMEVGEAYQIIDLLPFSTTITNGTGLVSFGGFLRDFSGQDVPEMFVSFYDVNNSLISTSNSISSATDSWTYISSVEQVPTNSTSSRIYLKGTRNAGEDNDSYFDKLDFVVLSGSCSECLGSSAIDIDNDGYCSDIDCNDNNPEIYPGRQEICDGIDNNCDNAYDSATTITWIGNANDNQWSNPTNWDQMIVPLSCQFVVISTTDTVIVDGIFACRGIDTGPNCSLTVLEGSYLIIDSQEDSTIVPACINGLLNVNGQWEVRQ